jgi:N-acetylmuramoyl-L-alanine amidase
MSYNSIVISSGHGLHVAGASGLISEVDEARLVVDRVAIELRAREVAVEVFHDDTSKSQSQNLETIVDFHNEHIRDLDVSVHFNAFETTTKAMGTEVLYVTKRDLAADVSDAIAMAGGFIDRGPKERTDLYFLNQTDMPAILIEVCFVDSEADVALYGEHFDEICAAIAEALAGEEP